MKKRKWSAVILALTAVMLFSDIPVSHANDTKDGWYYEQVEDSDKEGWRYYKNGKLKVLNWIYNTDTGVWNYLDADGVMKTGWGDGYADGYYFDEDGTMVTGWHYLLAPKRQLVANGVEVNGNQVEMSSPNEESDNTHWYYFRSDGTMAVGWEKIDGSWHYFGDGKKDGFDKGAMLTGRVTIDGNEYFFDEDAGVMQTGFLTIDEDKYYFSAVGIMKKDCWIKSGKNKYYAGKDGKLYCGEGTNNLLEVQIDGKMYYFDPNGKVVTAEVYNIDGKWTTKRP